MFCINVWITVKNPTDVPRVRELLTEMGRLSRLEPGCVVYEACHSQGDTTKFLLCERWQTKTDWEHHRTLDPFKQIYEPQVLPLVDREPHFCDLL
jgi:quinol monooxygenase YgiN